jgi:putative phosphoribosyl transferase
VAELFRDREDAGRRLAAALATAGSADTLVLGLARGGVVVAAEVARALGAQLDGLIVRKVGAPGNPEYAIGAVVEGGYTYLSQTTIARLRLSPGVVRALVDQGEAEVRALQERYRGGAAPPSVVGRHVILVDDGLATGATMRASVVAMRRLAAGRITVACPVGSPDARDAMRQIADEVVLLVAPWDFFAVGYLYERFDPVSDEDVRRALEGARARLEETQQEPRRRPDAGPPEPC